jgi:hypothetical protein
MPAKWQTWFPLHVDAFRGSPAVQAMHPAARAGYIYLLGAAWQSEDCTIPDDPLQLAELSGLGDDLWQVHGPRIIRKFEPVGEALRNPRLYAEWLGAKRIFESRQGAATKTNLRRGERANVGSSDGDRSMTDTVSDTVSDESPGRFIDTGTGTTTQTSTETKGGGARKRAPAPTPTPSREPDKPELKLAREVLDRRMVPGRSGVEDLAAQTIGFIARGRECDLKDAAAILEKCIAGYQSFMPINGFWFEDGHWREMCLGRGK